MLEALKSLFENEALSEEVRTELEEAWNAKIKENRLQVTAELREEFAKKYEHDKTTMVEAIDSLVTERLAEEIAEFQDDRKQLAEAKAKFAVAQRQNANLLKSFVSEQLAKEVKELHTDQKAMADKFVALEEFVVESLAKELAEFYEDKKDLAETKVRLVREGKAHVNRVKKDFISKSAALVSETVSKGLSKESTALKEDIEAARKNDFGRKLFEAFANEYGASYLNESKDLKNLQNKIAEMETKLNEANSKIESEQEAGKLVESKLKIAEDRFERKEKLNELMAPLGKEKKEIMSDLLESVKTENLEKQFNKYLPSVLDGDTPRVKQTLSESVVKKEHTGDKAPVQTADANDETGVVEIDVLRKLAGLSS